VLLFAWLACTSDPEPKTTDPTTATDPAGDSGAPAHTVPDVTDSGEETGGSTDTPTDSVTADTGTTDTPTDTATDAPLTAADCFADIGIVADYDQFAPVLNSACMGTDHQDITGVEHVVFVGDSVTVGTPPTSADEWYRNVVADALVTRFGLEAPGWQWENVNLIDGVTYVQDDGDFSSCAKWGARTDDVLQEPHQQITTCIPEERRDEVTLVIMTVGGNDFFSLLEDIGEGMDEATLEATMTEAMVLMREAAEWVADPANLPNGGYLVFANTFDFSDLDAAEDFAMCPGAELIGMDAALENPVLNDISRAAQEEFMSIAVDTQTDMVFMGEAFCGRGYGYESKDLRCYRGPDQELWMDVTCMHPSGAGHGGIAELVLSVVEE